MPGGLGGDSVWVARALHCISLCLALPARCTGRQGCPGAYSGACAGSGATATCEAAPGHCQMAAPGAEHAIGLNITLHYRLVAASTAPGPLLMCSRDLLVVSVETSKSLCLYLLCCISAQHMCTVLK